MQEIVCSSCYSCLPADFKAKVFAFDPKILSAIQALRNERTATMYRYDQMIQSHWQNLKPHDRS